jgi:amidase
LTERELGITETSNIQDLLDKLANGSYTAVEVTTAFIKRAVIAQQVVRFRIVPSTS